MDEQTILLGEREDKPLVKIMVIIFGIMCIITAAWWTVFLVRYPDNENIFWAGSIFLLLFGLFQLLSGLGYTKRYISRTNGGLVIRQNSLMPAKRLEASGLRQLEIRSMDMVLHGHGSSRLRIKLGIRYPDLGQQVKEFVTAWADDNDIEIFYKNEAL